MEFSNEACKDLDDHPYGGVMTLEQGTDILILEEAYNSGNLELKYQP